MSSLVRRAAIVLAATAPLVASQTLTVDNTTIDANVSTVAPAADTVSVASSNATVPYFPDEAVQLTPDVLTNLTALNLTGVDMFDFGSTDDAVAKRASAACKVFPGDKAWPSDLIWTVFDLLLGGALIKTTPLAAPCYSGWPKVRNAAECSYITNNWSNNSQMHAEDPTSVMWPLYQGRTCMPTDDPSDVCTLGGYPSYAVAVTNVAQIQLAINFARNANLRLVVKNTGHDFNGKSAGAGALSIWTHKLKSIKYLSSYTQGSYKGPAMKLGTGVQAFELYQAADQYGVTAIGGEGRTVGVAGGYMLGGGHSPLSSIYGMAADHLLSMEVVLPSGAFVTASDTSNPDLFWALRGGGGSTFGVVTSITVKVYPKIPVAVSTWSFMTGGAVTADVFWEGVRAYFDYMVTYTDAGCYEYFQLINLGGDQYLFGMAPFFAPNHTQASLTALQTPLLNRLTALGIAVSPVYYSYDKFYDAWWNHFPLESVGATTLKTASRLFPKSNWANATILDTTFDAIKSTVQDGATMLAFNIAAAPKSGYPNNAVNPAWRQTVLHAIQAIMWDEDADVATIATASKKLTNDWMQTWRDVSPGAGAYMSEADILEPNFQQAFYGTNYNRLYQYKKAVDPWGLFYAPTAVGSENWAISGQVDGLPTQNGKLCPA